jgi:1-acyl-sn-glycerol-3-phosphate acyltransferase
LGLQKNKAMSKVKKIRKEYNAEELEVAIEDNKYIYDEHFDIKFVRNLNESFFKMLSESYFRAELIGFDEPIKRNSPERPVILASNHSGMAFPWDAMVFGCMMYDKFDYHQPSLFRVLTSPMLSQTPAMHPYFMTDAWKLAGGIDAKYLNFETMMQLPADGGNLLIYPEGVPGIGKGFNRKYQLQRFATSFVRMSIKYKTDIISYSTVNAEYVAPLMYSWDWLNRQINKIGVPFLPLGPLTLLLLFPFAFYLAFPCKMRFVMGRRISPWLWSDKPYEELTDDDINVACDRVREMMQEDLTAAVAEHGRAPYKLGEFFGSMWRNLKHFPYNTPLGWAFLFHDIERQWLHEGGKEGQKEVKTYTGFGAIFRFIWRAPITIAYFIPFFGWLILVMYGKVKWKRKNKRKADYSRKSKNPTRD